MESVLPSIATSSPRAEGALSYIISLVARSVRQAMMSSQDRVVLELVMAATERYGQPLLESDDLDDLDIRLDELVENPSLHHLEQRLSVAVTPEDLSDIVGKGVDDFSSDLHDLFGPAYHIEARDCAELFLARAKVTQQLSNNGDLQPKLVDGPHPPLGDVIRKVFTDITVPASLRDGLVGAFRSELCLLAILHSRLERSGQPWLTRALVERFRDGMGEHLTVLASLPGVDVDESLVPMSKRIDFVALAEKAMEYQQQLDVVYLEAAESEDGTYAPFGEPIIDD